jgi:hypothetical protein
MPRFFKRMFKFPQMDFEMAIWEIMSLIIAPKKVFRQIYYHVCVELYVVWARLTVVETNNKDIPSTRSIVHIPSLLLPDPYIDRVGLRIRRRVYADPAHNTRLHIRPLPVTLARDSDTVLLPRRPIAWAWKLAATWATERTV